MEEDPVSEAKKEEVQPNIEDSKVITLAFGERKVSNLAKLQEFNVLRETSFKDREQIILILQAAFSKKVQCTKFCFKEIIRYFKEYLSLYTSFFKAASKFELTKKPAEDFIYEPLKNAVFQLATLNCQQIEQIEVLTHWVDKTLQPALRALVDMYKDESKALKKDIEKYHEETESARKKEKEFYEKLSTCKDLLQSQIHLFERFKQTDLATRNWGNQLYKGWLQLLKREKEAKELLQNNILEFHAKFIQVYNKNECSQNMFNFWASLPLQSHIEEVFLTLLGQKQLSYINFNNNPKHFDQKFENFLEMGQEIQRVGNPIPLIDILIQKKFKCKIQKSTRDWLEIRLYFTVDRNLLFVDESKGKIVIKLRENKLGYKRLSENILVINGTEEGIIFDSNKKESVHFQKIDELEEFAYFIDNVLKTNE